MKCQKWRLAQCGNREKHEENSDSADSIEEANAFWWQPLIK
jgi:hypothetical protein